MNNIKSKFKEPKIAVSFGFLAVLFLLLIISSKYLPFLLFIAILTISGGLTFFLIYLEFFASTVSHPKVISLDKITELIIEDMREGVVLYTPDFKIIKINPTAEKIFGLKKDEVVGKKISPELVKNKKFKPITQVIFPSLAPVVDQISSEGWPQQVEIKTEEPNLHLITSLNRVTDPQGKTLFFIKIIQDKTREEKILESKTEFITTSAHQLRTPLNAMSWAFESLYNSLEKKELKEIAAQGMDLSERALKIINDLLDVIQIEEGQYGYYFKETGIVDLIEKVVEEARPVAKEYGITLKFEPSASEYNITIDPNRIGIVLSTLIDNAIRYNTENGSVNISIEKLEKEPYLQINVSDTGIGIPPEEIGRIFEKFYRGSAASQAEPNGSGLGLYIVKNIVERHGGKVWVESTPGRGSTFHFTLPLNPSLIPKSKQ